MVRPDRHNLQFLHPKLVRPDQFCPDQFFRDSTHGDLTDWGVPVWVEDLIFRKVNSHQFPNKPGRGEVGDNIDRCIMRTILVTTETGYMAGHSRQCTFGMHTCVRVLTCTSLTAITFSYQLANKARVQQPTL